MASDHGSCSGCCQNHHSDLGSDLGLSKGNSHPILPDEPEATGATKAHSRCPQDFLSNHREMAHHGEISPDHSDGAGNEMEVKIDNLKGREPRPTGGAGRHLTSESSFETISRGAWLMESSCSGDVRAMSTSVRISFKTTSQRLGLLRTFLYLYIFFWVGRERWEYITDLAKDSRGSKNLPGWGEKGPGKLSTWIELFPKRKWMQ